MSVTKLSTDIDNLFLVYTTTAGETYIRASYITSVQSNTFNGNTILTTLVSSHDIDLPIKEVMEVLRHLRLMNTSIVH